MRRSDRKAGGRNWLRQASRVVKSSLQQRPLSENQKNCGVYVGQGSAKQCVQHALQVSGASQTRAKSDKGEQAGEVYAWQLLSRAASQLQGRYLLHALLQSLVSAWLRFRRLNASIHVLA